MRSYRPTHIAAWQVRKLKLAVVKLHAQGQFDVRDYDRGYYPKKTPVLVPSYKVEPICKTAFLKVFNTLSWFKKKKKASVFVVHRASLVAQVVKNLPAMRDTQVRHTWSPLGTGN